jgi:hypothetical protein
MWLKFFLLIAALVLLFSLWQHKLPQDAIMDFASGTTGVDPQVLADAAGVDVETYSLARVGQSEEGLSSDRAKTAVMYAVKNHAARSFKTITAVVTAGSKKRSDYDAVNGYYGRQGIHPYCSSIAAPTANTLALAAAVMDGSANDETQGAQWFDNPHTQDLLALANPKDATTGTGYYTSAEIAARRIKKGATLVTIDGVSTRFWA